MGEVMGVRGWFGVWGMAGLALLGACGSGEGSAEASDPPGTTERPENMAEVFEEGSYEECIGRAILSDEGLMDLSATDGNLTRAASPEQVDLMVTVMADCLGTIGVAEVVAAEYRISGARVPADTADCLAGRAAGDEVALLRWSFALVRDEAVPADELTVSAAHFAACIPGSMLFSTIEPFPLTQDESTCLDDALRSSPGLTAYFRSLGGLVPMSDAEAAAVFAPVYDCADVPARILANAGGTDGLSDSSLDCLTRVAREQRYYEEGVIDEASLIDFQEQIYPCFTEADLEVLNGRS